MSLSRDRLARPIDISTLLPNATRTVGLIVDEPGLHRGLDTPVRHEPGSSGAVFVDSAVTAGHERSWNIGRSPPSRGNARLRALRRARARNGWPAGSGLRSWYPRTPLRDVTAVVRAIERRRQEANESREPPADNGEDQIHNLPRTTVLHVYDENAAPSVQESFKTPLPASFDKKPQPTPTSRAWGIVASIAQEKRNDYLTPEKKLLGSIEKVREALMEDERRMLRSPAAKKAERQQKIRTLMSMR